MHFFTSQVTSFKEMRMRVFIIKKTELAETLTSNSNITFNYKMNNNNKIYTREFKVEGQKIGEAEW
jgi:hypothetical protein